MDSTQAALVALVVGVLIGSALAALVLMALRARDRARIEASFELPDGTRSVLQGMDDVAVVVDTSLLIVAASPPAELFGMQEGQDLPGDDLRLLVRAARRAEHPESENLRLKRGIEPRLVTARASVITARLTLVVIRDITERERVEEMRRDFVANTSHELKTPVGAVTLLAEAIESAADDPDQVRHFASRLTAEAGRLGQLTSRIMNLSRLQSADDLTELRDVSVDEVVAAAIESQWLAAQSADITIARGGSRRAYVRGDVQVLTDMLPLQGASLVTGVVLALALPIVNGILITSVGQSVVGRKATVGEVWAQVRSKVWPLIGFSFLSNLVVYVATFLYVLLTILGFTVGVGLGIVLLLLGLAGLVAFLAWFIVRTLLIPPALVLEGQGFRSAVVRGWTLTRGAYWRTLGISLLAYIAVSVIASIVVYPFSAITTFLVTDTFGVLALTAVAQIISSVVTSVFLAGVVSLLYIDVRMRREGLDVELTAAANEHAEHGTA